MGSYRRDILCLGTKGMGYNLKQFISKLIRLLSRSPRDRKDPGYPSDETLSSRNPGVPFRTYLNDGCVVGRCSCRGEATYSSSGSSGWELRIQCNDYYGGRIDCFYSQVRRRDDRNIIGLLRSGSVFTYETWEKYSDQNKAASTQYYIWNNTIKPDEIPS